MAKKSTPSKQKPKSKAEVLAWLDDTTQGYPLQGLSLTPSSLQASSLVYALIAHQYRGSPMVLPPELIAPLD